MSSYINSCEERYCGESSDDYSNSDAEKTKKSKLCSKENKTRNRGGKRNFSESEMDKFNNSKIRRKRRQGRYEIRGKKFKENPLEKDSKTVTSKLREDTYSSDGVMSSEMKEENTDNECVDTESIIVDRRKIIKQAYKIKEFVNSTIVSLKQVKPIENTCVVWREGITFEFIEDIANIECIKSTIENAYGITIAIPCKVNNKKLKDDEVIKILKDADNVVKLRLQITKKYSKNLEGIIEKIMNQRDWPVRNIIAHTTWAPVLLRYPVLRETTFSFVEFHKTQMVIPSSGIVTK
uniref:PRE_C2HC domain-containing protein n=1 Tax=Strongyloides papillosus TaxID=174720 RepID=A0A0N5B2Q0_STREA